MGKDLIILVQYTYRPITSTFKLIFTLFWYQINHCFSPRRWSYASLKHVVICDFHNRDQEIFHFLIPLRWISIWSCCLIGFQIRYCLFDFFTRNFPIILFWSSFTFGSFIRSKNASILVSSILG